MSGSSWAGGYGVDSRSNGVYEGTGTSCGSFVANLSANPPQYGEGWQCVELAQRMFNTRGWYSGTFAGVNYAAQIYTTASQNGWTTMANGSITLSSIVPGDMLITHEGTYGHVMLVDSISGNTINVVDQNAGDGGHDAVSFANGSLSDGSYPFSGVVHSPQDTFGSTSNRIAYVDTAGNVLVKSGSLIAPYTTVWDHTTNGIAVDVQMSPNRIGVLDNGGNLWVSPWPMTGGWTEVWIGGLTPSTYQVADGNIAVLSGGMVYVKQGTSLGGTWSATINPTVSFKMAQNGNLAAVLTDGALYVAWGGYGHPFTQVATNFSSYAISNNDIAAVFAGTLDVMIGAPVGNHWNATFSPASTVQLAPGGNIGVVDTSGYLDVAWGGYGSPWTSNVANNYTAAYVSDNQIGVLWGNYLDIKVGSASGAWTVVANNAVAFAIT